MAAYNITPPDVVAKIRDLAAAGLHQAGIARQVGIAPKLVGRVARREGIDVATITTPGGFNCANRARPFDAPLLRPVEVPVGIEAPEVMAVDVEVVRRAIRLERAGIHSVPRLAGSLADGSRNISGEARAATSRCADRGWLYLTQSDLGSVEFSRFRVTAAGYRAAGVPVPPWSLEAA